MLWADSVLKGFLVWICQTNITKAKTLKFHVVVILPRTIMYGIHRYINGLGVNYMRSKWESCLSWRKRGLRETFKKICVFSQVTSNRTRGNGHKLLQERFRLEMRKNFFAGNVEKYWNGASREAVESLPLKVFMENWMLHFMLWFS